GARRTSGWQVPGSPVMYIAVAIAVVVMVVLVRSHRISTDQLIYFVVLVPSIILHEISHGVVALAFGDDTAKRAGRLNLNPIRHIDPVGTLLVPALLSLSGIGAYGWAKPVPVNANRLRSPRNHVVIVSLVGPLTNFALAAILGVLFAHTLPATGAIPLYSRFLFYGGIANIVLGVFNLIPCPPLDGAAVLERLLPARLLPDYYRLQPVLMFLPFVLILLFRNQWSDLINHVINWWQGLVT
ncbi:MAG TPA: site-2 protease family protein, partial [Acidimicrobiales bacterium]|nr:site-2 protease family protein [Acidimicrobiales bacterium]